MDLSNNNNNNNYKVKFEESGGASLNQQQRLKAAHYQQQEGENQSFKNEQITGPNKEVRRRRNIREDEQQNDQNHPKDSLTCLVSLKPNSDGNSDAGRLGTGVASDWRIEESSFSRYKISSNKEKQKVVGASVPGGASIMDKKVDKIIDRDMNEDEDVEEVEEDSAESTTPATAVTSAERSLAASCSSSSSASSPYLLARVDPIVDFFTVDDELFGRFRICSCSTSTSTTITTAAKAAPEGGGIQPAIIFKIKTTSPYAFWVRPIYGLMRPNVICWVEVKCDMNREAAEMNSRAKLVKNMDEFLVEICPVPGAINTMTSDLYTSTVHSNVPELLDIWEKVEQKLTEQTEQQQQDFAKEFHRVSCRFQRLSLTSPSVQSSGVTSPLLALEDFQLDTQMQKDNENHNNYMQQGDANSNNNVKIFQWNPSKTMEVGSKECCHLAREFPYHPHPFHEEQRLQDENSDSSEKKQSVNQCCTSKSHALRKLCFFSFVLAILLLASLSFIFYTEFVYPTRNKNSHPLHSSDVKNLENKYDTKNDSINNINNNELYDNSNKTNLNG